MMDDKLEEIVAKYSITVKSKIRSRGALLLETDLGLCLLKIYNSNIKRIEFEENVKNALLQSGYQNVDYIFKNVDGEFVTKDNRGNSWILKKWYYGEECDTKDILNVSAAAKNLAVIHNSMILGGEYNNILFKRKENTAEDVFEKRNREMKRVRSYIKSKKQKNQMELLLMKSYGFFCEQGIQAQKIIVGNNDYDIEQIAKQQGRVAHGSYNYHNIIINGNSIAVTNFDKAAVGLQISDLADFLRKIMEKNNWDVEFGRKIIESYQSERSLQTEERKILYALIMFPEKYWKIANYYYNSRKAWMSAKNYEKLKRICEQEENRKKFIDELQRILEV